MIRNDSASHGFTTRSLFPVRSHVEISVHVEADDAEVVTAGHVGDDALSAFPLLRHSHPHVPVPQLQDTQIMPSLNQLPDMENFTAIDT